MADLRITTQTIANDDDSKWYNYGQQMVRRMFRGYTMEIVPIQEPGNPYLLVVFKGNKTIIGKERFDEFKSAVVRAYELVVKDYNANHPPLAQLVDEANQVGKKKDVWT